MKLSKEDLKKRFGKWEGFLYAFPQNARQTYLEECYELFVEDAIDNDRRIIRNINEICRTKSYNIKRQIKIRPPASNRNEEWFVLDLFWLNTDREMIFGNLINYQIPLRNNNSNNGVGKIDFISEINNNIYLHEIKDSKSKESILKAILEIQTYFQQLGKKGLERFKNDFKENYKSDRIGLSQIKGFKKSIIIFDDSIAYKQLENEHIQYLIKLFEIELFFVRTTENGFEKIN